MWGWSAPRARVTVHASWGDRVATRADAEGRWRLEMSTPGPGGPHKIRVASRGEELTLHDVLLGEVWLASGQSNMAWPLEGRPGAPVDGSERAIAGSADSLLRMFTADEVLSAEPMDDVPGAWQVSGPQTAGGFSAGGYFFASELRRELGVPLGIIHSSWGGTPAESWTPIETLESIPGLEDIRARFDSSAAATRRHQAWLDRLPLDSLAERPPTDDLLGYRSPTVLYNAMIHPLIPYRIRGALWYQGESNVFDPRLYAELFPAMVESWRERWGQGAFPFYYVQIAPYDYVGARDEMSPWLRLAQADALQRLPASGMVVTMDIGNPGNIHPSEKFQVGRRLALLALAGTYDREGVVATGPTFDRLEVRGSQAIVHFTGVGSGLCAHDPEVTHVELAGSDGRFVPARAVIDADRLLVTAPEVSRPVAVRYGWSDTAEPNLFNAEGLPAAPFNSRSWEAFEPR